MENARGAAGPPAAKPGAGDPGALLRPEGRARPAGKFDDACRQQGRGVVWARFGRGLYGHKRARLSRSGAPPSPLLPFPGISGHHAGQMRLFCRPGAPALGAKLPPLNGLRAVGITDLRKIESKSCLIR